jgi:hypothetical protein
MAEKLRYKQLGDWETLKKNGVSDADGNASLTQFLYRLIVTFALPFI